MNGNKAIFCLKEREYSSSVPVRYTPKKSLETEEPETSPHSKGLKKNDSHESSAANALGRKGSNSRSSTIDKKLQTRSRMTKKNVLFDDVKRCMLNFRGPNFYILIGLNDSEHVVICNACGLLLGIDGL